MDKRSGPCASVSLTVMLFKVLTSSYDLHSVIMCWAVMEYRRLSIPVVRTLPLGICE